MKLKDDSFPTFNIINKADTNKAITANMQKCLLIIDKSISFVFVLEIYADSTNTRVKVKNVKEEGEMLSFIPAIE